MSQTVEVRLNFTAETAQAEQALNRLQTSLRNISTQSNMDTGGFRFTQELNSASDAAIKLRQNLSNAINTNTNKLDLSKFRKEMDKSGMSLEKYRVALQQIGPEGQNAFVDLSKAILASQTPLTHSIKLFDKLWDTLKRTIGWQISSQAVHGIQGALSDAYKYAQDLNKSLNNIRIVTGYSADRMADFAKQANKAAKELSATTLDYTDASLIYYQQGLDDKAVKERTDTTIKMANVTGTTAQTVSQQMTAVWENFMKDGQHATEYYADVMAALGATTASSTDEIADGLEKFAAVADTVGLSYEYATSALATITAKTRQSADVVGTALKTLFARIEGLQLGETLEDGTTLNKYSSALEAIGVNIKDDTGNLKAMDNILSEIGAKWETLSKDQQVALAQTVAGVRQYTQFVALMDNWDFMGENLATAYGAEGTLEKQQKIYEESWKAARNRLQASIETLYDELLKDDFFIWLTDALSDVVGLIDKIVNSMGGLAGLLPGLILLMNKLFGDKIINGISSAAYNIAGLIPSVNQKRQKADLATRDQALVQLKALRDYQAGGGRGGEAVNASIKAYEQISKIEETRLRLGKSITSEQAATLDIYREQLEIMEKAAQKQGQAYNDSRKARNEQMNYVKILQAAAENEIRKSSGPIYRSGAGSSWLNRVGANYTPGMDLKQGLPTKGSSAARGVLKYVRENSKNSNIQWADIQSYANGDKTAQNYNIVAQAIERLRDTSTEAGIKVQELQKILEFNARSMSSNPDSLQYQAEKIGILESAQEQLSNIMQRVGNTNDVETLSQLGAEFKKILTTAMTIDKDNAVLKDLDKTINNVKATSNDYLTVMQKFIKGGQGVASISGAMDTANKNLNKTMQDLVVKYKIAPEAVTELTQAMRAYAKDSSKTAEVVKALNDAIRQSSAGMGKMSTQIDRVAQIQNVVQSVSSLAMGISSLQSAIDAINNPDLSGLEKFTSVAMSVSITVSSLMGTLKGMQEIVSLVSGAISLLSAKIIINKVIQDSANASTWASIPALKSKEMAILAVQIATEKLTVEEGAKKIAELAGIPIDAATTIAERILAEGRDKLTAKTIILAAVEAIKNGVFLKSLATILALIGPYILLAAALGGVAFVIAKVIQAYQNQETAQEKAARQADEAARATENAKKAYEELCNTIDSYESGVDKLKDLEEGTLEFKQALIDTNERALELINKLNLIYGKDWKYDDQGKIVFLDENGNIDEGFTEQEKEKQADKVLSTQQMATHYNNAARGVEADEYFNNYDYSVDKNTGLSTTTKGKTTTVHYDGKKYAWDYMADSGLSMTELLGMAQGLNFATGDDTMSDEQVKQFYQMLEDRGITDKDKQRAIRRSVEDVNASDDPTERATEIDKQLENKRVGNAEKDNYYDSKAKELVDTWGQVLDLDETAAEQAKELANIDTVVKKSEAAKKYDNYTDDALLNEYYENTGIANSDEFKENYKIEDGKLKKKNENGDWEEASKDDQYYVSTETAKDSLKADAVYPEVKEDVVDSLITSYLQKNGIEVTEGGTDRMTKAVENLVTTSDDSLLDEETLTNEDIIKIQNENEDLRLTEEEIRKLHDARLKYNEMTYEGLEDEQQSLAETASNYSSCSDEVTELKDAVKKYGKESKTAQNAQKKLNQALKNAQWTKFAKNIASAIKELKNLDKNGDDYKNKCQEIADAWNDIFDPDITADFVADNEELFTDWMNSSGEEAGRLATKIALKATEAADTVNSAFTKALEWKGEGDAPTGFEKKINNMQELYAATEAFLEANPLEIDAEGRANLTPLLNALMGAGASAEQVAKILAAIGQTQVEIDGQLISTADISKAKGSFEDYLKSGGFEVENFQLQAEGKGSVPDVNPSSIMTNAGTGGGGGGSKKDKKKASDEIERYHVVKQQLDRLSSEYDQLSAAKDRAYGPDKLKAIDKEIAKLQEQEAMQKRYLNEIERYYQQDRAAIAKYGAVFDANGIITNYDALMQKQLDIFNASLTDEAEEAYNAFKETLDQYEETLALKLEESGNLLDKQYEIVSAKLEKITYKVEYKIEIEDDKLDYLERRLTRLSEVEKASLQVFAINQDKIMSYWIQYATYAEAIKDIEAEINAQKAKGLEITDEQIQKLQDYKNSMGEIEDNIYDLYNDEIDSISDRYSNLFDQLEKYQDRIRDYRDSLETIKDMYSLLGVATVEDNRAMNDSIRKTYQAEAKGIQNEIDLLKARREELYKARDSLGKSVDKQGHLTDGIVADIKQLEDVGDLTIMEDSTIAYSQKFQDQIDEINQQVHEKQMEFISWASDYLNAIKDQWIDNLELIGQKTKDALYEGLEWAIDKYGDLTDISELYLSDTRKIYELNKLNRSIQADINKIDNVAAKTKLRDLMKDINGYYADNVKMSEYELKNLQAQYELRLAEIALEDARNAKSEVRLTRDNEGRWGYMYTANTEEVDKAEQELEDKRYELQQLQEDTLKDAGEKILSLQNDYIDAMTELQSSDLSDEQKKQRAEELTSLYQKQLDYYYETYAQALEASGLAYEETILGQATNTKSLQEVMETFGHASIEMTDQMISETQKYQEAFIQMVSDITGKQINSYEEAQKAWLDYMSDTQKALNEATTQATNNFNEVAEAIKNMSTEFKKMIDELMVYLARLSGEDMSLLFYSALANGDYEMAERYAKARRQKIDSNPDEYGQYDWNKEKMNQIIDEKAKKDKPLTEKEREALLATAKEPYKTDKPGGWAEEMQDALKAGEYDKAGQYAEYRAYKVHNAGTQAEYAWTEADLQRQIDQYAKDPNEMTEAQRRRILATASQYDTGGYTGSWGNEGRWALLHEKELVLNKNDTSNLLTTITLLHDLMARLDQASAWSALRELTPASATTTTEILEQNVHIEASFPNAVDHNEIEQAFENIVNLASQYANRK